MESTPLDNRSLATVRGYSFPAIGTVSSHLDARTPCQGPPPGNGTNQVAAQSADGPAFLPPLFDAGRL